MAHSLSPEQQLEILKAAVYQAYEQIQQLPSDENHPKMEISDIVSRTKDRLLGDSEQHPGLLTVHDIAIELWQKHLLNFIREASQNRLFIELEPATLAVLLLDTLPYLHTSAHLQNMLEIITQAQRHYRKRKTLINGNNSQIEDIFSR